MEGLAVSHTCLGRIQWKNRWELFLIMLHLSHLLLPVGENLVALSTVASALRISLQVKVLMIGGIVVYFHTLYRIVLAWGIMLMAPVEGICTVLIAERYLKIAFVVPISSLAEVHLRMSMSALSTTGVFMMC